MNLTTDDRDRNCLMGLSTSKTYLRDSLHCEEMSWNYLAPIEEDRLKYKAADLYIAEIERVKCKPCGGY